jgi:hypothetical protein
MTKMTKSLAWLWIAALLTATVGVSVQRIYCYCVDKAIVTLFASDDACQMQKQESVADCCVKHSLATRPSCCEKGGLSSKGCTQKTTEVFQLKPEFLVDKPFEKTFDLPAWVDELPIYRQFLRTRLCEATLPTRPPPAPPPVSGRMACVRYQIFRL